MTGCRVPRAGRAAAACALGVALAACSVPDVQLTGKACPCTTGYVCDTASNQCRVAGSLDAGSDVGSDASSTSCLGSDPGAVLYRDTFDGTFDWTIGAGTWPQAGGVLDQTDIGGNLNFAYTTGVPAQTATYRVTAKLTGVAGGTGLGIAVRVAAGQKTQYDCVWEPGTTGALILQSTNTGGNGTTIASTVGVPDSGAMTPVTMELSADGAMLRCCIDDVQNATVAATDASYATGEPGLMTVKMQAMFDDFVVYAN